jgi:hypothetical protein
MHRQCRMSQDEVNLRPQIQMRAMGCFPNRLRIIYANYSTYTDYRPIRIVQAKRVRLIA